MNFRDWLRTHESDREAYVQLKKELAAVYHDGMSFANAKTEFVAKILDKFEQMKQNNQEKFAAVDKIHLPLGQYAITGSGPLGVRNLKEIADIDIIVTPQLWDDLAKKYGVVDENNVKKIVIPGTVIEILGDLSFYTEPKEKDEPNITERISQAEMIDNLPFEALKYVVYYKRRMGRPKDLMDIMTIETWQKEHSKSSI